MDQLDQRLLAALQVSPRAGWGEIGRALGEHERTVARRSQRLLGDGVVRVTAVVDDLRAGTGLAAHVRIRTANGRVDEVGRVLAARGDTRGVFAVTGADDIWCELVVHDRDRLHPLLCSEIAAVTGVDRTAAHPVLRTFTTVARWHGPLLTDTEVRALRPESRPREPADGPVELSPVERRLVELLTDDGRVSYTDLAAALRVSVPTAIRWVSALLDRGLVRLRAEVAPAALGLPVECQLCLRLGAARLDDVGRALAAHPAVRYCAAITGPDGLVVELALAHEDELYRFVTDTVGGFGDGVRADIAFITHAYKRGHLLSTTPPG